MSKESAQYVRDVCVQPCVSLMLMLILILILPKADYGTYDVIHVKQGVNICLAVLEGRLGKCTRNDAHLPYVELSILPSLCLGTSFLQYPIPIPFQTFSKPTHILPPSNFILIKRTSTCCRVRRPRCQDVDVTQPTNNFDCGQGNGRQPPAIHTQRHTHIHTHNSFFAAGMYCHSIFKARLARQIMSSFIYSRAGTFW